MLSADQVATAPCTDRVQEWFRTFEAKRIDDKTFSMQRKRGRPWSLPHLKTV